MTDPRDRPHAGSPRHGWGGPPWAGPGGPRGGPGGRGFPPGRRFRRAGLAVLAIVVLLVAALATIVASALSGNAPEPWITVVVSAAVVAGLVLSARWLWRNARAIGGLMDAADRVANGDYSIRVREPGPRQLARLTTAFNEMTTRLESNETRRRELLADVAHELRTPLQVIRGTLEGMIDGLYPADPARLRPLLEETLVMARLLEDLRTLSMAEAGVLELHRETVDPRSVIADVVAAFGSIAEEAAVDLDVATDAVDTTASGATIEADPLRLAEILSNLVDNALRHTPRSGRVTVGVTRTQDVARFAVEDTGPGIPADRLPFVFDRFVTSADAGGTGLGLAIAKRLVEAHGGTIEAVSPSTGGTTIRFELPGEPSAAPSPASP